MTRGRSEVLEQREKKANNLCKMHAGEHGGSHKAKKIVRHAYDGTRALQEKQS